MTERSLQIALAVLAVGVLIAGAASAAAMFDRVEGVGHLTRDVTSVAGVPWWTGAVSRLTNLVWAAAATANLLAVRGAPPSSRGRLMLLGLFCVALAIDDTLLVHEAVLPGVGVPDELTLGAYAVAGLVLGWLWLRASGDAWVRAAFFAGGVMLAVSLAADAVGHGMIGFEDTSALLLVEDGAKLAGVVAWLLCGVWAARDRDAAVSDGSAVLRAPVSNRENR